MGWVRTAGHGRACAVRYVCKQAGSCYVQMSGERGWHDHRAVDEHSHDPATVARATWNILRQFRTAQSYVGAVDSATETELSYMKIMLVCGEPTNVTLLAVTSTIQGGQSNGSKEQVWGLETGYADH